MRLYCLSNNPNNPCFLLKLPHVSILLDCGLDMNPLLQFLPQPLVESARLDSLPGWKPTNFSGRLPLKDCNGQVFVNGIPEVLPPDMDMVNLAEVDAIIISNHTNMLALPFITELKGFKGAIYATDPTLQLGRLYMEEIVEYFDRIQSDPSDANWKETDVFVQIPSSHMIKETCGSPKTWRSMYSRESFERALSKITLVAYRECVDLFGLARVIPVSSGYCIGSCNWLIETDFDRIGYISSSSSLATHPKAMDSSRLKDLDLVVLSCLNQTGFHPDVKMGEFCDAVIGTLREHGNVLVPCYPSGVIYDIFEYLSRQLDSHNFSNVPLFFVSPAAESSLAFSNIFAEWLSDDKQSKVYIPEEPFPHGFLVKNGRLKHYQAIYKGLEEEFRSPCVVFTGHPSLRLGDGVHFMELWGSDARNAVIMPEPEWALPEVLAPFQPLVMKAFFCPVDTSLDLNQAGKLLKEIQPKRLHTFDRYTRPSVGLAGRMEATLTYEPMLKMKRGQVFAVPSEAKWAKMQIDHKLSAGINFEEFAKSGTAACPVIGLLSAHDNHLALREPQPSVTADLAAMQGVRPSPYGKCDVDKLLKGLRKSGLEPMMERVGNNATVSFRKDPNVVLEVGDQKTTIKAGEGDEKTKSKILDVMNECFDKL